MSVDGAGTSKSWTLPAPIRAAGCVHRTGRARAIKLARKLRAADASHRPAEPGEPPDVHPWPTATPPPRPRLGGRSAISTTVSSLDSRTVSSQYSARLRLQCLVVLALEQGALRPTGTRIQTGIRIADPEPWSCALYRRPAAPIRWVSRRSRRSARKGYPRVGGERATA